MARKKRFDKMATFMIEKTDWEKLHKVAEKKGCEVSYLLRKIIKKEITREGM